MINVHRSVSEWQRASHRPEFPEQTVGLVPTTGSLHSGHRVMLERAWRENDRVVLSIFRNPTTLTDHDDQRNCSVSLEADLSVARGFVSDVIILHPQEMFPDGYLFKVIEEKLSFKFEGIHRPGHFAFILTVALKLFNLVRPERAYFGEIDWQQLELVRGMARAFFLPCQIVACPTVRDDDGLALSSRNVRLSTGGRAQARHFPRILRGAPDSATAARELGLAGFEVEYVHDLDGIRLGAVRVENVRLIDNMTI